MKKANNTDNMLLNQDSPTVMHIDLNSCFATIEQQANRLLRGRPVGVAAYDTPRGFVLAASYQAKSVGVKLGVNVAEARQMCPGIVIMTPDPAKYRHAHKLFREVLLEYSDDVVAKSIDEFVIEFAGSLALRSGMSMRDIGNSIKTRIYEVMGEAVTVNIGIGPNRFLAKFAAGFDKPNGLTQIDGSNMMQFYQKTNLIDLPGINIAYQRRLRESGIHNPVDFLAASRDKLYKQVFKSVVGDHWYMRLRGHEVDDRVSQRRQIGHQYALPKRTADTVELARLLGKLCEKVGRRLRANQLTASGVHLYLSFVKHTGSLGGHKNGFIGGDNLASDNAWHRGVRLGYTLYSSNSIYLAAKTLLNKADVIREVRGMSITVFGLESADPEQLDIFAKDRANSTDRRVSDAVDEINNRYGEFVVTPGSIMDMSGEILDRIAFGSVRDL